MLDLTAEEFAQRAFNLNLINERQVESIWSQLGTRDVPPEELRALLLRREMLTNYQVERLLKGEKTGFFYGDYKVLYLVGTGSFARVYRAVHRDDTSQVVALKVLRKRHSESAVETEQFLREGRMGMELRHPNIVPIYAVDSVRRTPYLVMAFVEGQSLRAFVQIRRTVGELEASEIMAGVMSGLNYAAEKGITHRDLKLSNVLISSEGRPQLVDFGLAIDADSTSAARTVDYAGLEKLTGVGKDDPRSDIYFAGCMFYHLLSGHPPITESRDRHERSNPQRFKDVIRLREHLPQVNPHVEAVVERAMALDADRRYQKPVDMMVDLQKAIKVLNSEDADAAGTLANDVQRTVMLVESNETIQDAIRKGLKKKGHRALVISAPERAMQRLQEAPDTADCVIISTVALGRESVSPLTSP
ncbi:MAG: serine/threonine-protein kinase, partial [Planctomycetota bacterium]